LLKSISLFLKRIADKTTVSLVVDADITNVHIQLL